MKWSEQTRNGSGGMDLWMTVAAISIAILLIFVATQVQAQTFTVLHTFTGGDDGAAPLAGVTADEVGNLYGTAERGGFTGSGCGSAGCGTVFRLKHSRDGWLLNPLYIFQGGADGINPQAAIVIGPNGSLYSTNQGGAHNSGAVFNLRPPATACSSVLCYWTKTEVYQFLGVPDGAGPRGTLVFDRSGNIYGVTQVGGTEDYGIVYELTHSAGGWMESVLYSGLSSPFSGVIFDSAGNLYGTSLQGGELEYGSVYQLVHSGSGWTLNTLSSFEDEGDGNEPEGGLIFDAAGNLLGTTTGGGNDGSGTVFQMTPTSGWMMTNLYSFTGFAGSFANLSMDAAGNLYGTTNDDGVYDKGSVFKLTPMNGGWSYTDLHDFTGGSDGAYPGYSGVTFDASGNLYGTAGSGGSTNCTGGCGVVWEITP
jgi:hypothetical protein